MTNVIQSLKPCKRCGGYPLLWSYTVAPHMKEYIIFCTKCGIELTYRVDTNGDIIVGAPEIKWNYNLWKDKSVVDVWNEINPVYEEKQVDE